MDGDTDTFHSSRIAKTTTEDLQETVIPAVWLRKPTSSSSVICLHAYKLSFDPISGGREYSSFALLLQSCLPEEAANFCETFQLRHGKAVSCKIEPLKQIFLDHFQVAQAEQFQSALFSVLLDRSLEPLETKELPLSDGSWYLLLPLKHLESLNCSQDQEIDWNRIAKLKSFEDSKHVISMTENDCPKADGAAIRFSNGVINIEDLPGLLVETTHIKQLYWIMSMLKDLTADSPFPNKQYQSYADYFKIKHGCKLELGGQCFLKAKVLRRAQNFLLARTEEDNGSRDAAESFSAELPPEICSIKYFGLYEDLVNAAVILPSLLYKLESILVATQLHEYLSTQLPKESVVSSKKVLEALTTQKCMDSFSLERLELLGDSFLKYAISRHLFLVHEEADEGFLTSRRTEKICNASLFTLGSKLGLAGYIRDSLFDPKQWVAPCHHSKALCNESNLRDVHGESSEGKEGKVTCNKRHRWMQRKTIADATEALIGAYLEDGGENAALSFIKFIGLEVAINTSQLVKVQSTSMNNLSLIERIDIETLEKLLSYSFKHKGLLVEAFTHSSFANHLGKCYQRLEFLGDSVLDFLITHRLYKEFNESNPGELTDLRSTIVSNGSFARIAIQYKLHEHLIENSAILLECIKEFAFYIDTSSENRPFGGWDREKCPKVLGDIVESLCGAIYLDSGFDLSLTWKVLEPILQPLTSCANLQLHPVRELLEVCQKNGFTCLTPEVGRKCQYKFEIHVNNEVVVGAAIAKNKNSGRIQAAVDALAKLKALGYVHPASVKL
eukprot:c23569_g2_i1 orf=455-2809(+)